MPEKTKKPRALRVDSPTGVAKAIIAGGKNIALPPGTKLDAKEKKAFTELCDEFSKTELTPHKVRLAISLAKNIASLDREQDMLRSEGSVLVNSHGNAFPNPRAKVCTGLTSSILSTRRSLGIHTRALEGGNHKAALRRSHNRANEATRDDYGDEGLIPFPDHDDSDDSVH